MLSTQNNNQASALPKSATQIHTRDELSKIAKVGHDTYGKGKTTLPSLASFSRSIIFLYK